MCLEKNSVTDMPLEDTGFSDIIRTCIEHANETETIWYPLLTIDLLDRTSFLRIEREKERDTRERRARSISTNH